MGTGRPRWKFSFQNQNRSLSPSSSPSSSITAEPPEEFLCPIAGSLMADPVIIPSGQTFERSCIQACAALSFTPPSLPSSLDLSNYNPSTPLLLIPNVNLKTAILNWCDRFGLPHPVPLSPDTARDIVRRLMPVSNEPMFPKTPPLSVRTNKKDAYSGYSGNYGYSDHSSVSSHHSSTSFPSYSEVTAEPVEQAYKCQAPPEAVPRSVPPPRSVEPPPAMAPASRPDSFEENTLTRLIDSDPAEQEAAMVALRQATRENRDRRRSLCTPRLLAALRPMLLSDNAGIQINAAAAMVNLSLETENKVRIVRSGAVSPLVEVLKSGHPEARDHAAGAIYSLALEDGNRAAIGVLGAIPPLLKLFSDPSTDYRARREAGMALYYVSLGDMNRSKLARTSGAVKYLVTLAALKDPAAPAEAAAVRRLAMMVVANLAGCPDGRAALMDGGAVAAVASLMRDGAAAAGTAEEEYCLSALHGMSRGSLRFRGLARAAGVEAVLMRVAEDGEGGVRREMAKRTLRAMRGEDDQAAAAAGVLLGVDCEDGSVVSEGLLSFRRRPREYGGATGSNTTKF